MSAPATNDFSPAPVTITARALSSCLRSRIARRSSSSVGEFSALSTLGRLIVSSAIAPSRSSSRLSKAITKLQREREHQPSEDERRREETGKHQPAEAQLLAR